MAVAAQLFRLEQLDSEIEQHEAALADLRRRHGKNPELDAAEARSATLRDEATRLAVDQRSAESLLADLEARIKRDNARMYSGQIVDSRELASIEHELEHHRAARDAAEEQVLTLMERLETAESESARQTQAATEARARWETERPEIARRHNELRAELAELRAQREELAGTIDPRSLNLYTRLRAGSGHAVSHVTGGVCQWCRVALPPKDVQHARVDVVSCTNCGRILYTGP